MTKEKVVPHALNSQKNVFGGVLDSNGSPYKSKTVKNRVIFSYIISDLRSTRKMSGMIFLDFWADFTPRDARN